MLLRCWLTLLLLLPLVLIACGGGNDSELPPAGFDNEPPTPPPLEGIDVSHLVEGFPQVPVQAGEFWVRPGSISNLLKKQQPPPVEELPVADVVPLAAMSPAAEQSDEDTTTVAADRETANEQLAAEHAAPSVVAVKVEDRRREVRSLRPPRVAGRGAVTEAVAVAKGRTVVMSNPSPAAQTPSSPAQQPVAVVQSVPATAPGTAASNNLSVAKAALAIRIENRQPVGVSDTFAEGTKVYLFNTILNPGGKVILVHHKWYRGEERVTSIKLSIKAARWRTWSVIPVYGKGPWRVDIVEPSGRVLHTEKFTVE